MIHLSEIIKNNADDAIYYLGEVKKTGNPAVIKNYVAAIRKDLNEIERAVSYEV